MGAIRRGGRRRSGERGGCKPAAFGFDPVVQTLEEIQNAVKQLSKAEQEALRVWLDNLLEDELEFTDKFEAEIERGERDIAEGRGRVVKP